MKEIMGITNVLYQALQQHSQDLLNAMHLVSTTKSLIQKLRDDGWEPLLANVISFVSNVKLIFLIRMPITLKVEVDIVVKMMI